MARRYWVNMTSFGYTTPGGSSTTLTASGFSRTVMIDSGSTYSYIDADLVATIAKQFGATISGGVYYVSCSYLNVDGYVNFGFNNGNMVINAKYSDFIIDFGTTCALGVQAADVGVNTWVLGTSFIRSAYRELFAPHRSAAPINLLTCSSRVRSDVRCHLARELRAVRRVTGDRSHRGCRKPALD